jgi:DNA-binding NtrC family response regulator
MYQSDSEALNVLIVDDDPMLLDIMVNVVNKQQHQAVPAESAEEILKLLPFWTFHVAFIDHNLPGMEGMMLGEYLRRNNPHMVIAIVTGAPSPALERRSAELGLEFISKPFGIEEMSRVIEKYKREAMQREQARREQKDDDFVPPIARFSDAIPDFFEMPNVPSRIESRLTDTIKRSLNNLRSVHRYNERDRVIAFTGLLSARALGIRLPKTSSNRTLYEVYDDLMHERGRRREFH